VEGKSDKQPIHKWLGNFKTNCRRGVRRKEVEEFLTKCSRGE